MFASLAKRSSYKVIEEEKQSQMGSAYGQNPPQLPGDEQPEEEEEDDHEREGGRSMFESAPPNRHGIDISFKRGEEDPESLTSSDDSTQWDHIKDIDQFFVYIYEYYQQKGFTCIALRYLFSLLRFAFVVIFSTFLLQCVDYDVLFYNRNTTLDGTPLPPKRRIQDAFIPQCHSRLNPAIVLTLLLATLFWIIHFIRIFYRLIQFYEIKHFFGTQLHVVDAEMQSLTWAQLVQKLCLVQQRLHLVVNKDEISSLDIYQRILRHKNYFVGLVYHDILPPLVHFPLLGSVRYLSTGLRFNLEWLLFWGPWSPWKGPYALKEEYKDPSMLPKISNQMQRTVAIMALVNLIFFPFIFIYQLLFLFFSYSEHFQRDSQVFGMRKYASYGREKLRHFNEMDHELDARLNRSYEFAARYTDQFISPMAKIVARNTAFVAASIFVVLCGLTAFDEDTLKIEHVTTMMTLAGAVVLICRIFIPSENLVFCQQFLMRQIVANIHYAPKSWLRNAHSVEIHREFTQIFRLRVEILVEELLSPILSPLILYFSIYKRVPQIVTFLHEHTVHIEGLGDICSLAQMDISRDGDVRLASLNQSIIVQSGSEGRKEGGGGTGRRHGCGKAELSLLNFAAQNPDWVPPKAGAEFIRNVNELVALEISNAANPNEDPAQPEHQQPPPTSSLDAKTLAFVMQSSTQMGSLRQMEQSQREGTFAPTFDASIFHFGQRGEALETSRTSMTSSLHGNATTGITPQQHQGLPIQTFSTTTATAAQSRHPQTEGVTMSSSSMTMSTLQTHHAFTNSRLLASSFITPSPLAAIVQPRAVQESNLRATQMSLHALAVNHMLFLNTSMEQQLHQSRLNRVNRGTSGYGSVLLGSGTSIRRGGRYGGTTTMATGMDSLAESNIWGVPAETSQLQLRGERHNVEEEEDGDAPLPLNDEHGRLLLR